MTLKQRKIVEKTGDFVKERGNQEEESHKNSSRSIPRGIDRVNERFLLRRCVRRLVAELGLMVGGAQKGVERTSGGQCELLEHALALLVVLHHSQGRPGSADHLECWPLAFATLDESWWVARRRAHLLVALGVARYTSDHRERPDDHLVQIEDLVISVEKRARALCDPPTPVLDRDASDSFALVSPRPYSVDS